MQNKIKKDQILARKNKSDSAQILTTLLSEVTMIGKNNGNRDTTTEEAIQVINKFKKNLLEVLKTESNPEKLDALKHELEIYESYLPKQMTKDEISNVIKNCKSEGKNIGQIMKFLKENYNGQYDGRIASQLCKEL